MGLIVNKNMVETGGFEGVRKLVDKYGEVLYTSDVLHEMILISMNREVRKRTVKVVYSNIVKYIMQ